MVNRTIVINPMNAMSVINVVNARGSKAIRLPQVLAVVRFHFARRCEAPRPSGRASMRVTRAARGLLIAAQKEVRGPTRMRQQRRKLVGRRRQPSHCQLACSLNIASKVSLREESRILQTCHLLFLHLAFAGLAVFSRFKLLVSGCRYRQVVAACGALFRTHLHEACTSQGALFAVDAASFGTQRIRRLVRREVAVE